MKLNRLGLPLVAIGALLFPRDISLPSFPNSGIRGHLEDVLALLHGEHKSFLCPITAGSLEEFTVRDTPEGPAIGGSRTYKLSQVKTMRDGVQRTVFHLQSAGNAKYPTGICIDFDGNSETYDLDVDECPAANENAY